MLRYLPFLLVLALWIYAFIDCLNTPEEEVKGLPKVVWVIVILLFGEVLVGPVAWLVVGKVRRGPGGGAAAPAPWRRDRRGEWTAPDDNPAFLASLKEGNSQDGTPLKDEKDGEEELLRRREEEIRRREQDGGTTDGTPPK